MDPGTAPDTPLDPGPRPAPRYPPRDGAQPPDRRRRDRPATPAPARAAATARAALRYQRLDGPLLTDAAALRARARYAPASPRGVRVLHDADTGDARAAAAPHRR